MRILLIDDHALFVQGLKFLLGELDTQVDCVICPTFGEALLVGDQFDLVLLDYHLPDVRGNAGLRTLRDELEGVPIVMLSGEEDSGAIQQLIADGAYGFIPKSSTPEILVGAIKLILSGGVYLPPMAYLHRATEPQKKTSEIQKLLTERQLETLLKAVQGKANKVIAKELNLTESTIKAHLSSAFRVLGVSNRTEAVYMVGKLGLQSGSV